MSQSCCRDLQYSSHIVVVGYIPFTSVSSLTFFSLYPTQKIPLFGKTVHDLPNKTVHVSDFFLHESPICGVMLPVATRSLRQYMTTLEPIIRNSSVLLAWESWDDGNKHLEKPSKKNRPK